MGGLNQQRRLKQLTIIQRWEEIRYLIYQKFEQKPEQFQEVTLMHLVYLVNGNTQNSADIYKIGRENFTTKLRPLREAFKADDLDKLCDIFYKKLSQCEIDIPPNYFEFCPFQEGLVNTLRLSATGSPADYCNELLSLMTELDKEVGSGGIRASTSILSAGIIYMSQYISTRYE